jgi:hypothetical protein
MIANGFRTGDFVYGLRDQRKLTIRTLQTIVDTVVTVDQLNHLQSAFVDMPQDRFPAIVDGLVRDGIVAEPDRERVLLFMDFMFFSSTANYYDMAAARSASDRHERPWLSKSCKAAILLAILNKTQIHFILDGLDQRALLDKRSDMYGRYTGVELRSAYKTSLGDEERAARVLRFYRDGVEVPAPWNDPRTAQLWADYRRRKA